MATVCEMKSSSAKGFVQLGIPNSRQVFEQEHDLLLEADALRLDHGNLVSQDLGL